MGKSKRKGSSEVEFLRGEVRRLKSELKYYKRRNNVEEPEPPINNMNYCEMCGKGILATWDFRFLRLHRCTLCGHEVREKIK
jgi:hypothetical protein